MNGECVSVISVLQYHFDGGFQRAFQRSREGMGLLNLRLERKRKVEVQVFADMQHDI